MFTNRDLKRMIVPLFLEQLLMALVGIADVFVIVLNMGVMGIALAMCLDWSVRGIIFWCRSKQGKWKTYKVI